MNQVIEIRSYTLKPGATALFHQVMLEQSLPMLLSSGIDVIASRSSLHSTDSYLLIRAYSNLAQRSQKQDEFYGSTAWLQGPREAVMACIESYTTVVIEADQSTIDSLRHVPFSA